MADLAARVAATEKVVARFRARPFDWRNRRTCIHLARAQAIAMGHRPPMVPDFRSPRGARAALDRLGFADLPALLDSLFPRIAPAATWVGDLVMMEGGEGGFDAIGIAAGGKIMGYHEEHLHRGIVPFMAAVGAPFIGAWRL